MMRQGETQKTEYIVLRHTPFQESGLLISGISPELGRLDFLVRGARSQGKKKFPVIGLFREFCVEFHYSAKSIFPVLKNIELQTNFDALALRTSNYLSACSFAKFLLENTKPMLDAEETYRAFRLLLLHFCEADDSVVWPVLVRLAFLCGNGLIPQPENESGRDLLDSLFAASQGEGPVPELSREYWQKMDRRLKQLLSINGFAG